MATFVKIFFTVEIFVWELTKLPSGQDGIIFPEEWQVNITTEHFPGGIRLVARDDSLVTYIAKGKIIMDRIDLEKLSPETDLVDKNAEWYFGIHGWLADHTVTPITPLLVEKILKAGPANIILVDWSAGADLVFVPHAVDNCKAVGRKLAHIINGLVVKGLARKEFINLIGFSLGGEMSGFVGKTLFSKYGWKPKKITAVDPGGPGFEGKPPSERVDSTDGHYVEVYHTCSDVLSLWKPVGHVDIYVNTGQSRQPGCSQIDDLGGACSHMYGISVYGNFSHLNLIAYRCPNFHAFVDGNCHDDLETACPVDYRTNNCRPGVYRLNTTEYPKA